jgi:signal peptidase I
MSILIFLIVLYILVCFTLTKLFEKAGISPSKAWIPGVNFMECCELIGRPRWWAALLLIPIVNIFIYCGITVDLVRSFGRLKFIDSFWAVVFAPVVFWQIGNDSKSQYLGKTLELEADYAKQIAEAAETKDEYLLKKLQYNNPYKKSELREWTEAIIFAVFAASFIRMFLIEAYVIPTSSMESSLLVGDFLFVSKAHYGIRTPQTVASIPLLHNRLPFDLGESYLNHPSLDYHRFFKIQDIKRNDPVVFNYPEGDSVFVISEPTPIRLPGGRSFMLPIRNFSVHDFRRMGIFNFPDGRALMSKMIVRPMDKMDFYIKRCVAISGDSIKIINKQLYVNGQMAQNPPNMQYQYTVKAKGGGAVNLEKLKELDVNIEDTYYKNGQFNLNLHQVEQLKAMGAEVTERDREESSEINFFPHDTLNFKWGVDNFGSLYIPKAGATIQLTPQNMSIYRRSISVYEHNKLEEKGGKIYINDQEATSYTFKLNYYWMMGDNRHNSEDARVWGFVPETHVVGKPLFIWFSTKNASIANGIRWRRIFTSAYKM